MIEMNEVIWIGILLGIGFKVGKTLVELAILLIALIFTGIIVLVGLVADWWLGRN